MCGPMWSVVTHADPALREILRPLWRRLGVTRHFHPASFWWRHQS
ncbi:hypothetical protein [Streptomyces sp. NPDC093707]